MNDQCITVVEPVFALTSKIRRMPNGLRRKLHARE